MVYCLWLHSNLGKSPEWKSIMVIALPSSSSHWAPLPLTNAMQHLQTSPSFAYFNGTFKEVCRVKHS